MAKQLSDRQRAHIERLKESGHYQRAGAKGGATTYRRYGKEGMSKRGFKGGVGLIEKLGGLEKAREFYSEIGSMKPGESRKMGGR